VPEEKKSQRETDKQQNVSVNQKKNKGRGL